MTKQFLGRDPTSSKSSSLKNLGILFAILVSICSASIVVSDDKQLPKITPDSANEQFLRGPTVKSSGNIVQINDKQVPNEYYGNIYIGSELQETTITYDTLSSWTVIASSFDLQTSETGYMMTQGDENGTAVIKSVDLGMGVKLEGPVYIDKMCLIHTGEPIDIKRARLCINRMPFIHAPIVDDVNTFGGVLGLARGHPERNYAQLLRQQQRILKTIVSFNYEDPEDVSQRSQVAFGEIIYSEIEGGEEQTNFYSNMGRDKWGLMIDDFLYDEKDMTNGQSAKIALIDSANVGIQLPKQIWENLLISMKHDSLGSFYKVIQASTDKGFDEIRIENRKCSEVWQYLKPIQFKLENTTIIIQPRGYTYQQYDDQDYCQIGLHATPDNSNEYRLGTIFLRNFYTALDFDNDLIIIGVNKGSAQLAKATFVGHKANPLKHHVGLTPAQFFLISMMTVLAIVTVAFCIFRIRDARKKSKQAINEQQESFFDKREEDESDEEVVSGEDDDEDDDDENEENQDKKGGKASKGATNYLINDSMNPEVDESIEDEDEGEEEVVPVTHD